MAIGQEVVGWLRDLNRMREHAAFRSLTCDAVWLFEEFERNLRPQLEADARANIVSPFTAAVREFLIRRGITLEPTPPSVVVSGELKHSADIGFRYGDTRWVVEIKTGLEFNSLGAAVLGGLAFKAIDPSTRFVLLCLYLKARRGNLCEVLTVCRIEHAIDDVFILSRNGDGERWYDNFATSLNLFVAAIPRAN